MKIRIALLLMGLFFLWRYARAEEPKAVKCDIGHYQESRPEKWEFYWVADGDRRWISEHDSRESALKACNNAMKAQEKRWKQQSKGKSK